QVDGADNVQTFTGLPRATPSQEAAKEFRVLNSTYLAEYGRALGGFVNIVTKSGTNRRDGSLYYFGMDDRLSARSVLNTPDADVLHQHQFGLTLGAPIVADRTFFFGNYEGQVRRQSNRFSQVVLDNLAALNVVRAQFNLKPETTNQLQKNHYNSFMLKVDHHPTLNHTVAVRYNFLDSATDNFLGGGGRASPTSSTARDNLTRDQAGVDVNYLRNESRWDLFFPARIIFPSLAAFQTFTPAVFWWPYLITASSHPGVSPAWTDDVPPAWADATRFTLNHSSYGFFAQDHWQAADRLSLTYGLRYDIEAYPSAFIVKRDLNNVQPRIGGAFAYSAHGVVRGGYGVFFDRLASSVGQLFNATQWSSAGSLANAQLLFPTIAPLQGRFQQRTVGGALAPAAARTFLTTGQVPATSSLGLADTLDGAIQTPYSHQASVQISHEIG